MYKWYRMPQASTYWRMDYRSNDPARRLSADGQGEYTAAAVAAADADIDFSGYDLIYVVPARNQTAIASSPELNNYTHQIVVDGNDLGNGDTMGSDMSASATSCSPTRPATRSASSRATTPAPAAATGTWASGT